MGAGQSNSGGKNASGTGQEIKTSYYELLGVDRQATEEELKKAYRRKALELHPDRNYGNEEAATRTFAEIQAAYEILSDPQERAWYDSHESAILRGDDAVGEGDAPTFENVRVTTADDLARLVRKFNSRVEFSDAPSGFFGFVRETFEQLAKEEEIAASWENVDIREYPSFGHQKDEYNDVVRLFYASWSSFATVKTFAWKDKYRLSEAPDRWYRRRMEQENNHLRQDAKREFNDAVRSLVAFIRKRDPRYVPSTQTEVERQKVLRDAAAAQAARARAANEAKIQTTDLPEWTRVPETEELEEFSDEEESDEQEILECVACDKTFKSEKQWEAHEKSKKHQKAIRSLKQRMRKEDAKFDLEGHGVSNGVATPDSIELEKEDDEEAIKEESNLNLESDEVQSNGHPEKRTDDVASDIDNEISETDAPAEAIPNPEPSNSSLKETPETAAAEEDASNSENEDYASLETIQARIHSISLDTPADSSEDAGDPKPASKPKLGKAAQKRAKKAAAAAAASSQQAGHEHECEVCNGTFPSKTKLFQHIKDEGHAALKSVQPGSNKGKKNKGKR